MVGKNLLDVETTLRTGVTAVVELRGELDVATSDRLHAHIAELLNSDTRTVILDLSHLEFVDSTGLAAFIEIARDLRRLRGSLSLANAIGQPFKVMELTGVLRALGSPERTSSRPPAPAK